MMEVRGKGGGLGIEDTKEKTSRDSNLPNTFFLVYDISSEREGTVCFRPYY